MRKFIDRTLQDQRERKSIRNAVITMVFFAIMDRALKILKYIMKNYMNSSRQRVNFSIRLCLRFKLVLNFQ